MNRARGNRTRTTRKKSTRNNGIIKKKPSSSRKMPIPPPAQSAGMQSVVTETPPLLNQDPVQTGEMPPLPKPATIEMPPVATVTDIQPVGYMQPAATTTEMQSGEMQIADMQLAAPDAQLAAPDAQLADVQPAAVTTTEIQEPAAATITEIQEPAAATITEMPVVSAEMQSGEMPPAAPDAQLENMQSDAQLENAQTAATTTEMRSENSQSAADAQLAAAKLALSKAAEVLQTDLNELQLKLAAPPPTIETPADAGGGLNKMLKKRKKTFYKRFKSKKSMKRKNKTNRNNKYSMNHFVL